MNVYDSFFAGISDEDWEYFAEDFLNNINFMIISGPSFGQDGGKDLIVEYQGTKYIVSGKHFITSGKHVGVGDEESIIDRIIQHNVDGFIGFYSTGISSKLQERLDALNANGYPYIIFDRMRISNYLPYIRSDIMQKYGILNKSRYVLNVPIEDYRALPCQKCSKDILNEENISLSLAGIYVNSNNEYEYKFGCKHCFYETFEYGCVEIIQILHLEEFNAWNNHIESTVSGKKVSNDFYYSRSLFQERIAQRIYPSNWGTWL